jgi:hypothetical protein
VALTGSSAITFLSGIEMLSSSSSVTASSTILRLFAPRSSRVASATIRSGSVRKTSLMHLTATTHITSDTVLHPLPSMLSIPQLHGRTELTSGLCVSLPNFRQSSIGSLARAFAHRDRDERGRRKASDLSDATHLTWILNTCRSRCQSPLSANKWKPTVTRRPEPSDEGFGMGLSTRRERTRTQG